MMPVARGPTLELVDAKELFGLAVEMLDRPALVGVPYEFVERPLVDPPAQPGFD